MRDIDFLPRWYPAARWRVRVLQLQCVVAAMLLVGLGAWLGLAGRNTRLSAKALDRGKVQLAQSELELDQLRQQLDLQAQLELQQRIVTRLGMPLEASRLLRMLDGLMPREMSLREITFDVEDVARPAPLTPLAGGAAGQSASAGGKSDQRKAAEPIVDRRLKVKLLAVAPSDVDLANVLGGLARTPFFENVAYTFSRDKAEGGHLMREFEITFNMSLNLPVVSAE